MTQRVQRLDGDKSELVSWHFPQESWVEGEEKWGSHLAALFLEMMYASPGRS